MTSSPYFFHYPQFILELVDIIIIIIIIIIIVIIVIISSSIECSAPLLVSAGRGIISSPLFT